ncbi:MAG: SdpI family protein [Vicingaceae bacterium]
MSGLNIDSALFIGLITIGPIFVMIGLLLALFPPTKMNGFYGYRSPQSMKSQKNWAFAQVHAAAGFLRWGLILTAIAMTGLLIPVPKALEVFLFAFFTGFSIYRIIRTTEKDLKHVE